MLSLAVEGVRGCLNPMVGRVRWIFLITHRRNTPTGPGLETCFKNPKFCTRLPTSPATLRIRSLTFPAGSLLALAGSNPDLPRWVLVMPAVEIGLRHGLCFASSGHLCASLQVLSPVSPFLVLIFPFKMEFPPTAVSCPPCTPLPAECVVLRVVLRLWAC